jgi:copper chaperone CopZ
MRHIDLIVGGMHCRRCVREVTGLLRDVPGVQIVNADAGSGQVRVSGLMRLADVLAVFTGSDFRPQLLDGAAVWDV